MSAQGIPYSGVLADRNRDQNETGGVFDGLQFWLSARVPQRKSYIETIQKNGGSVVLRERNAEILICDPKDPLPDSFSYKLIDHAVKEGSLDAKEDYLCSAQADLSGSSKIPPKTKLTRNRFSAEDDRLLLKFVTEKERLGEPISGNEIYMEFAKQHPHHTWHSWRDRWVKKLRNLPRPKASNEELPPRSKARATGLSGVGAIVQAPTTRPRPNFTAEEDELLLETIHNAIKNHEPWNGFEPYKRLADEFPQRTHTSWRNRALNHVAKLNMTLINEWDFEADSHLAHEEDAAMTNIRNQRSRRKKNHGSVISQTPVSRQGSENVKSEDVNDTDEEIPTRKHVNEDDSDREHQGVRTSSMPATSSPEQLMRPAPDVSITNEEQFYRDYETFLESAGVTERQTPSVGGRAIALWDLWQSTRSAIDTAGLDWTQIAEDLGFDWVSMESVPAELQFCYEEHLAPFAEAMMGFDDLSDGISTDGNADKEPSAPLSSAQPAPSLKRPSAARSPAHGYASSQGTPKRRKIDTHHEVPSTPDHLNGTLHLRQMNKTENTPNGHHGASLLVPGTRSSRRSEDKTMKTGSPSISTHPRGRKRRSEPETQDFIVVSDTPADIDDEAPANLDDDSQVVLTPSHQLRMELDAVSSSSPRRSSIHTAPRQKKVDITPIPPRPTRVSFQKGATGEDSRQKSKSARSSRIEIPIPQATLRRRTLPLSYETTRSSSSEVLVNGQQPSTQLSERRPRPRPSVKKETPDDIINRFVSSGYTRDVVLCSLRATSWIVENAVQVMEMLKRGEPLPPRTSGVWTQRDDTSLALVYSGKAPSNEKEEKKRAKEMRRLEAKHGAEQIALRKRYLMDELPQ